MMALGGEEGLECEVCIDGICLEHVSKFKYLGCVLNEFGTDEAVCSRKVGSERRVAGVLGLWLMLGVCSLECTRVLHELWLETVLMYGSETVIWREKERLRIKAVQRTAGYQENG